MTKIKSENEVPELKCLQFGIDKPYMYAEKKLQKATADFIKYYDIFDKCAFHVPNERKEETTRISLWAQGVKAGVSDWVFLKPFEKRGKYHPGMVIELKVNGGELSPDQIEFLNTAHENGYYTAVCWNFKSFESLVKWAYLGNQK